MRTCFEGLGQFTRDATRGQRNSQTRNAMPLNSMLIPTSVPMHHPVLDGHVLQIMTAKIRVTIQSNRSHSDPGSGRSVNPKTNSRIASANR